MARETGGEAGESRAPGAVERETVEEEKPACPYLKGLSLTGDCHLETPGRGRAQFLILWLVLPTQHPLSRLEQHLELTQGPPFSVHVPQDRHLPWLVGKRLSPSYTPVICWTCGPSWANESLRLQQGPVKEKLSFPRVAKQQWPS